MPALLEAGVAEEVWAMAVQGLEWLAALDAHHIENMDPAHQRALLLEAAGQSNEEIAERENVSPSTVTGWIRIVSSEIGICLPAGARVGKAMRGYWVGVHVRDCLANAVAGLRGGG